MQIQLKFGCALNYRFKLAYDSSKFSEMEQNRDSMLDSETSPSTALNCRPQSPLSLTRHSRMVEKTELQHNNDRLASYIDRVRFLEVENSRLNHEVQMQVESHIREKNNMKRIFECEHTNTRKALDEIAKEKTRLEMELNRLSEENVYLQNHLEKKMEELNVAQSFEPLYNDLLVKYNKLDADGKKVLVNKIDLEKETVNLKNTLNDLRRQLENEILKRVETENLAQSLREELELNAQMDEERSLYESQQIIMPEDYGVKLEKSLHQLREQYETEMRANREEIDRLYKAKIANLQEETSRANASAASAMDEVRSTSHQISALNCRMSELESEAANYCLRICELESMLDNQMRQHGEDEAEIRRLREEMACQIQEYQDLMDIKVSLDLEIAAYGQLLAGEEERFKNTMQSNNNNDSVLKRAWSGDCESPSPDSKQPRTSSSANSDEIQTPVYSTVSNAKGSVEIRDSCSEGGYVCICNNGDARMEIGGWQLKRTVGFNETTFKFRRSIIIKPKQTIKIWSANTQSEHSPPENIVMKKNKWFPGEVHKTQLFNANNEEMAILERQQHYKISKDSDIDIDNNP